MQEPRKSISKYHNCRLCGGEFFRQVLELKPSPLAHELYQTKALALDAERFPLNVVMCQVCAHVQLQHIVNAERLYSNYKYASGTSQTFQKHFRDLAATLANLGFSPELTLEIGSNDGTLLRELSIAGFNAVGIEPSAELVSSCKDGGLKAIQGYANSETLLEFEKEYGKPTVIIGNNVFAHIEHINELFSSFSKILKENGVVIIEVAHLKSLVEKGLFDTIYHEHMSYHSILSFQIFVEKFGMEIFNVDEIPTHGGSVRIYISRQGERAILDSVANMISSEKKVGLDKPSVLSKISLDIQNLREQIEKRFSAGAEDQEIVYFGYGAPAKTVTFLSEMGLENFEFHFVVDDNQSKQGHYLPGSGVRITSLSEMESFFRKHKLDELCCIIFPWNLQEELVTKLESLPVRKLRTLNFFPALNERLIKS